MRKRLRDSRRDSSELLGTLSDSLGELSEGKRIAIFAALPDEPQITGLIEALPRHQWLLPRVDGDQLHFHQVSDVSSQLQAGAFGIMEPGLDLPTTPIPEIDIFICPGLAFDIHGGRLGRGRGFYDRVLAEAREDSLKIGVGFDCQMVEDVFAEEHDVAMSSVLCHG